MSEPKCEWGARKRLIWTGFVWDTEKFKLFVPEVKLKRVELLIEELWAARGEAVAVRKLAGLAGVIGSFTLAMGNCAMLTQVAELSGKHRWEAKGRLDDRVIGELEYWRKNLRKINGWPMRGSEDVIYCKGEVVNMFSDASESQLAGARIEEGVVSWDSIII